LLKRPGRTCPLSYRYAAASTAAGAPLGVDTLWVVGGLYGNPFALEALLEAYDAERGSKALVFNGDFHWLDVDPAEFRRINAAALEFHALRGNVETEIAAPDEAAGCGCGYPDWVDDTTVERSNRIIERLRAAARGSDADLARVASLPMHLFAHVGDAKVVIVHGDANSLAGWGFSQEALATGAGYAQAAAAFAETGADIFASSHTCLPVLQRFETGALLVNNGAAGMPNFHGTAFGLATRISVHRGAGALYSAQAGGAWVEAMPLRFDSVAWQERFRAQWPAGSDAHESYAQRIAHGPRYAIAQALRLHSARNRRSTAASGSAPSPGADGTGSSPRSGTSRSP
jgi:predicted phosphodiesterase